jgi:hypothetical protein
VSIILVSICKYHVTNNREADILVATAVSLLSKSWLPNCGMFSAILFNSLHDHPSKHHTLHIFDVSPKGNYRCLALELLGLLIVRRVLYN